jgi:ABC-type antimicrobial peptide transport system permease subunit
LILIITLGAGFYPALVLSSYKPSEVLKGASGASGKKFSLRHTLVSFQFAVSQIFIVCTLITIQQVNYIRDADMGFSKESIVDLSLHDNSILKQDFISSELDKIPGISSYTLCSHPPFSGSVSTTNLDLMSTPDFDDIMTQYKMVDENYIKTYELRLLTGEGLAKTDTATRFIINETLAKNLGFATPEAAIGEFLSMNGMELPITGVVEDFHSTSFSERIAPVLLASYPQRNHTVGIKIQAGQTPYVLAGLEAVWRQAYPDYQFEPEFLDEAIMDYYDGEQNMATLLTGFSVIAIIIGSLGLYGLVSFMVNQKTKEVGIRKTLGASTMVIIKLFSAEFLKLLGVGFIISAPLAWYIMDGWLQQFEYKISIGIAVFVVGLVMSGLIALSTVGYRSFRAAIANPVASLKED